MHMKLLAIVGLLLLLTMSCSTCKTRSPSHLRVVYIENASDWPFFVAQDKGLFDKTGLKVEIVKAQDSTEALNALLAGKADVSIENTYSVLFAIESKSPGEIRLFLPCSETPSKFVSHLLVLKDSTIKDPQELKGKKIGTYTGATQLLTLKLFLKEYLKWDPDKDVQIVQVGQPLQVQALAAGQYDALFTIEPFSSAALAKGIAKDILPYARGKILDPFPAGACSVRTSVLSEKKDALKMLYEGMVRAAEFIDHNPDEAKAILAKWTNLDSDSTKYVGGYEYYDFASFDKPKADQVQRLADLYFHGGIFQKAVPVESLFLKENLLH
jgi:NitT/TauT family transport system substrate-binding protein